MISSTKIEELTGKISDHRSVHAIATRTKGDDGATVIEASVSVIGITFKLEEIRRLLVELPKAVERASALTARLQVEADYEEPRVTLLGNMNDLLEAVGPGQRTRVDLKVVARSCAACMHSGIEPADMDLTCGHPDAGPYGVHVLRGPAAHCPGHVKFEQHPGRNPDGTLKDTSSVIPGV